MKVSIILKQVEQELSPCNLSSLLTKYHLNWPEKEKSRKEEFLESRNRWTTDLEN